MSDFEEYLRKFNLPQKVILDILEVLNESQIQRKGYFVRYNDLVNKIGVLVKGILVSRYICENGKEITSKFYYSKGDFIVVDYQSFMSSGVSKEEIQAEEDSLVLTLSKFEYTNLLERHPVLNKLIKDIAEESYLKSLCRIRDFQSLSAKQRVEKFTLNHRSLMRSVKIQDAASYLGISRNVFTKSLKN